MSFKVPSRVVFVGNIPYDLSEEQIIDIFNSAGKVINFRLVYDRETGRPKGFGFAEYSDSDSASSAVRNLHNYEIKGRRLRVDFSNEGGVDDEDDESYGMPSSMNPGAPSAAPTVPTPTATSTLPPLPAGKELPPGVTCSDQISRTLSTLPPSQMLDILSQVKALAINDPNRAVELFEVAPQLAYALFQALLLMNLVSPDNIYSVVDMASLISPTAGAPPPMISPQTASTVPIQVPPPPSGFPSAVAAPPAVSAAYGQSAFAPPPAAPAPMATPQPSSEQDELMKAVMALPQETIDLLPEGERQQILALRASFQGR